MKRYLRRTSAQGGLCFEVMDEFGSLRYSVTVDSDKRKQIVMVLQGEVPVAEIQHKNFVVQYFTLRCDAKIYILLPVCKEEFGFVIYGSPCRFAGDPAAGRFSLFDGDKSPVMLLKKCWSCFGDGYEMEILREEKELFAVGVAVCAELYLFASQHQAALE